MSKDKTNEQQEELERQIKIQNEIKNTSSDLQEHIQKLNDLIIKLKTEVSDWKLAWYDQREATGKMAWTVPHLPNMKDSSSLFIKEQYQRFISYAQELKEKQ